MKADEQEEINSEDKPLQQVKQGKKIEITKKLLLISRNYTKFMGEFSTLLNQQVQDLSPKFLQLETGINNLKKSLEKDLGEDERENTQKRLENLVGEKTKTETLLKKMTLFQTYQNKSMSELITITKANQEEFKKLEGKMKSGEISF
jgi:heme oxygenase